MSKPRGLEWNRALMSARATREARGARMRAGRLASGRIRTRGRRDEAAWTRLWPVPQPQSSSRRSRRVPGDLRDRRARRTGGSRETRSASPRRGWSGRGDRPSDQRVSSAWPAASSDRQVPRLAFGFARAPWPVGHSSGCPAPAVRRRTGGDSLPRCRGCASRSSASRETECRR